MSLAYLSEGHPDKALRYTQQALEHDPEHLFARCSLAAILIRLGRRPEAQPILDALRQATPHIPDRWRKMLETFVIAGEDTEVIATFERLPGEHKKGKSADPMMLHLAATAYARTGDEKQARKLWRQAQHLQPGFSLAQENLFDLQLPVGARNGPFYLPTGSWLAPNWLQRLLRIYEQAERRADPEAYTAREIAKIFEANPALPITLGILLDQGKPSARAFALGIAEHIPVPAANFAVRHGLIDKSQPVSLYIEGTPRELLLLGFEITEEDYSPPPGLPKEVYRLIEAAAGAIYQDQDGDTALEYIEQALAHVPDQPDVLDMKILSLMMADRDDDADDLVRRYADLYPDHFNARSARANLALRENDLDAAQTWLDPLLQRDRLTSQQFSTLANSQIRLLMMRGDPEGAMSWVRMWQGVDPDAVPPLYAHLADMVDQADGDEVDNQAVQNLLGELFGELDGELLSRLDAILTNEDLDMLFDEEDDD